MNAWEDSTLMGLYSIAPVHLGAGQASGAVDLPIARDAATGFPTLPSSSLKGVAREAMEMLVKSPAAEIDEKQVEALFGKSIEQATADQGRGTADGKNEQREKKEAKVADSSAGQLCFSEARLLAYPARALNRPFLHITCPLILERLLRELTAFGISEKAFDFTPPRASGDRSWARVATGDLDGQTLVIEDLIIEAENVVFQEETKRIASFMAGLIPESDAHGRERLANGLVILRDEDFQELMERIVPVRARIKLTGGKTTDKWRNPETGELERGNLWYEEYLPSDCLFYGFLGARRHWRAADSTQAGVERPVAMFRQHAEDHLRFVQIGGDETVGHGICYWHFADGSRTAGGASS